MLRLAGEAESFKKKKLKIQVFTNSGYKKERGGRGQASFKVQ